MAPGIAIMLDGVGTVPRLRFAIALVNQREVLLNLLGTQARLGSLLNADSRPANGRTSRCGL